MGSLESVLVECALRALILVLVLILILVLVNFCCSRDGFRIRKVKDSWVELISWEPRAFICHNFLSEKECLKLINLAKPHMVRSLMFDTNLRKHVLRSTRTSSGMFLGRGHNRFVHRIEKRIADFTFIPVENGKGLNILHYEVGQKFDAHYDFTVNESHIKRDGQRMATLLIYLSDVEKGGETVFPAAKQCASSPRWWRKLSESGEGGLSIKPKMGDALLFWNIKPDGTVDRTSLHGSCPVIKGEKWVCTRLMRANECKIKLRGDRRSTFIKEEDD